MTDNRLAIYCTSCDPTPHLVSCQSPDPTQCSGWGLGTRLLQPLIMSSTEFSLASPAPSLKVRVKGQAAPDYTEFRFYSRKTTKAYIRLHFSSSAKMFKLLKDSVRIPRVRIESVNVTPYID